jgi:hypothetical protein
MQACLQILLQIIPSLELKSNVWRVKSLEATQIICILGPFMHWTRVVCNLVCTSLSEAWGIASTCSWMLAQLLQGATVAALHSIELPVIQELLPLACDLATTELLHGVFVVLINLFQYATWTGIQFQDALAEDRLCFACTGAAEVVNLFHNKSWCGVSGAGATSFEKVQMLECRSAGNSW